MSQRYKFVVFLTVLMRALLVMIIDKLLSIGMGLPKSFFHVFSSMLNTYDESAPSSSRIVNDSPTKHTEIESTDISMDPHHVRRATCHIKDIFELIDASNASNATLAVEDTISRKASISVEATISAEVGDSQAVAFSSLMDWLAHDEEVINIEKIAICLMVFLTAVYLIETYNRRLWLIYFYLCSLIATILSVKILLRLDENSMFLEFLMAVALYVLPHICFAKFCSYNRLQLVFLKWPLRLILASPILMLIMPPISRVSLPRSLTIVLAPIILIIHVIRIGYKIHNWYQLYATWSLPTKVIKAEWERLNVTYVMTTFWTIRTIGGAYALIMSKGEQHLGLMAAIKKLIIDGCDTITAVMGLSGIIALIGRYIHYGLCFYLHYPLVPFMGRSVVLLEKKSGGVFLMLAILTGLSSLSPDMRYLILCQNMQLVLVALLHYGHQIVSPIMMIVGKTQHIRASYVCWLLWGVAWTQFWYQAIISSWSLSLTAYAIQVIVQTSISLVSHTLLSRENNFDLPCQKCDDYLCYLRTFGKYVDFCTHIVVTCYAYWFQVSYWQEALNLSVLTFNNSSRN